MFGLDKLVDPDALLQLVGSFAWNKYVAPLLVEVRAALLAAIAGDAPPRWAAALERAGLANLPPEAQARLWRAAIDAAAEIRAPIAEPPA